MAIRPVETAASAAQTAGRTMADAMGDAGNVVTKAAARGREEAEDMWAEAKEASKKDAGKDAAVVGGLVVTTALGVLELPVAAAVGAGYALWRRRSSK